MAKQIFEPAEVGGLRLKNRLVRSATWEGIAAPDGGIDETIYAIYDELARGGVGLVITGFASVAGNDRRRERTRVGLHREDIHDERWRTRVSISLDSPVSLA